MMRQVGDAVQVRRALAIDAASSAAILGATRRRPCDLEARGASVPPGSTALRSCSAALLLVAERL